MANSGSFFKISRSGVQLQSSAQIFGLQMSVLLCRNVSPRSADLTKDLEVTELVHLEPLSL